MSIEQELPFESETREPQPPTGERRLVRAKLDVYEKGASLEIDGFGVTVDVALLQRRLKEEANGGMPRGISIRGAIESEISMNIFVMDGYYVIKQGVPGYFDVDVLTLPPGGMDLGDLVTIGQPHTLPNGGTFTSVLGIGVEYEPSLDGSYDEQKTGKSPFERARDDIAAKLRQ